MAVVRETEVLPVKDFIFGYKKYKLIVLFLSFCIWQKSGIATLTVSVSSK